MDFKGKMSKKNAAGLADLLSDNSADLLIKSAKSEGRFLTVGKDSLYPDPKQPRKSFDATALMELRINIEHLGQLQAVLVRPADESGKYKLIAGERRWRAICDSSSVETIDIAIVPTEHLSDFTVMQMQRAENVKRDPLTAIEQAQSLADLVALGKAEGLTQADVARAEQMSASNLSKHLALLNAPASVRALSESRETQDVETLYNLAQLAEKNPEKLTEVVDAWRSGELEGNLRQAAKNALSGKADKPVLDNKDGKKGGAGKSTEEQHDLPLNDETTLEDAGSALLNEAPLLDEEDEQEAPQHVTHVANDVKISKAGKKTFLDVEFTNKVKGETFVLHFELSNGVLKGLSDSLTNTPGITASELLGDKV